MFSRSCHIAFSGMKFTSCFLLLCCVLAAKQKARYLHPLSEEAYDTLLLLVQGRFKVPVAERTREQRNAVIRYWRNRDRFHLGPQATPTLYFDDEKVVKAGVNNIKSCEEHLTKQAESAGCKKLQNRAAASLSGLSERNILKVTNREGAY